MPSIGSRGGGYGYKKLYATNGRQKQSLYQSAQVRKAKRQAAENRIASLQTTSNSFLSVKQFQREGNDSILYNQIVARAQAEQKARVDEARKSLDITV
jgi:hypothetical protein